MPRSSSTDTTSTTDTPATTSLSNKLYSREEDIAKLVDAYEKRDQRHLVLLVGQPGNGKTTLGSIIQPRVENDGGTFLTGRFDPLEHPEPFSPFIKASTQFVARALEAGQEESLTRIKTALSRAMDLSEIQTLTSIIPILAQVFGTTSPQTSNNQNQSTHGGDNGRSNFLVAFCNFMRAISHPNHPIVLFLDDLQSSDPGSLDVLKILVADKKIQGLLCIVAFRPVGVKHPFSLLLRQLEAGGILFVPVLPSPLDATSIQEWLVAHDLGLEDDRLEPMAQVIQQGTKGNAMAVKLCLRIMETNKDIVQETGGTPLQAGGDVKSLFKLLFMMVPSNCQRVCWVASCMGMEVDPQRLAQILPDNIPLALQAAEDAGIMMFVPHAHLSQTSQISSALKDCIIVDERDLTKGRYVFSNSTFKDCVYNLISDDDKKVQHTAIGNIYREADSNNVIMGIGIDIYRVVAHLSLGVDLLSPKGKEAFSRLCLQAGGHTSEWSEFVAAAKYLDLGIKLLDPQQKWRAQYELSIALYNASADVANCTGRYEEMDARLAEVLANAKDPLDKMRAYSIQMHSLSARTLHADALALGLKVLPKLGEVIPVRKSKSVVDSEVKAVRKLIEGTSEKEIMNMSPITDKKKLGAMKILNLLMASAVIAQGELVPLIACRMVRTTLQSGLAGASAVGFTALGAVLCAQGDIEVGTWCSELALNIVDQLEDKSCKGRVMAIHWGILSRFSKTWKRCQEPLKVSYRLCMEGGDNEFALISPILSILNMLVAGGPLTSVAEAMKGVYQLLYKKNQDGLMRIIRPFYQQVLNLMGATMETNPLVLTGNIMNEDEELQHATETFNIKVVFCIYLCQAELAFVLHKYTRAKELVEKCNELGATDLIVSSLQIKLVFLDAMSSIALVWMDEMRNKDPPKEIAKKKKKHMQTITTCLETLKYLALHAPENMSQKVWIVEGEIKAIEGDIDGSVNLFKLAMDHAGQQGNLADKTLACERLGLALRNRDREDDALDYLEDCCALYRQWGALIKVNHVKGNVIPQSIYEWDG